VFFTLVNSQTVEITTAIGGVSILHTHLLFERLKFVRQYPLDGLPERG